MKIWQLIQKTVHLMVVSEIDYPFWVLRMYMWVQNNQQYEHKTEQFCQGNDIYVDNS